MLTNPEGKQRKNYQDGDPQSKIHISDCGEWHILVKHVVTGGRYGQAADLLNYAGDQLPSHPWRGAKTNAHNGEDRHRAQHPYRRFMGVFYLIAARGT
jgi:hypothetical protein